MAEENEAGIVGEEATSAGALHKRITTSCMSGEAARTASIRRIGCRRSRRYEVGPSRPIYPPGKG